MRTIATALVSATILLASAAPGRASDETRFERLIRKYVPPYASQFDGFAPKTACICDPTGAKAPGVLLTDADFVGCLIPGFINGMLTTLQACGTSYVVLGK